MESVKKDWQSIVEGIRVVTEKTEKIVDELDRLGKAKSARKTRAPTETPQKRAAKKGVDVVAGDSVLDIIKTNGKGVDVAELKERTGLSEKEIRRAVFRLRKEGKVKRVFVAKE
jgi:predicted Rossmann fold nucleotide-binding protein DprA/Smf involved in DNA uptake